MSRAIIFGRINFKNLRSVKLARAEYIRHNETKAKNDLLFKPEDLFGEDPEVEYTDLFVEFDRKLHDAGDKTLTNSISALKLLLQFAIAGRLDIFILEPGELPRQVVLEVNNDKSTVHAYAAGMEAFEEKRYADSIGPFTDAIDSFAAHPWAYNARGLAHFELNNLKAAEADFKKARKLYPALPNPHLGLAKIAHSRGERAATIDNCERAMQGSIPHQPGYWISALFQAQVFLDLIEQGKYSGSEERAAYLRKARQLINRYSSKLRQLGSARNAYYPTPEEHQALQDRLAAVSEEEHAA